MNIGYDVSMWWVVLARAGDLPPAFLVDVDACADPTSAAILRHGAAQLAALGVPEGAAEVSIAPPGGCCRPMELTVRDTHRVPFGSLSFSADCTLLGARLGGPVVTGSLPPFELPAGPTAATAIRAAWPVLRIEASTDDAMVGWADGDGFRVALVRIWPAVTVAVAEVRVDADATVHRLKPTFVRFTAPADAMATTVRALGLPDEG